MPLLKLHFVRSIQNLSFTHYYYYFFNPIKRKATVLALCPRCLCTAMQTNAKQPWLGMRIVNQFRLGTGSESNDSLESLTKTLYDSAIHLPGLRRHCKQTCPTRKFGMTSHTQAAAEQRWAELLRVMHCGEMSQKRCKVWLHFTKKDDTSGIVTSNTRKRDLCATVGHCVA